MWPLRSQRQAASPFCFQNHPAPRRSRSGWLLGGEGYAHLSAKKQTRAGGWSRARLTRHPQNSPERLSVGKRTAKRHAESHGETSLGNEENKHGHTWQPGQTSGRKVAQRQPDTQGQVAPRGSGAGAPPLGNAQKHGERAGLDQAASTGHGGRDVETTQASVAEARAHSPRRAHAAVRERNPDARCDAHGPRGRYAPPAKPGTDRRRAGPEGCHPRSPRTGRIPTRGHRAAGPGPGSRWGQSSGLG